MVGPAKVHLRAVWDTRTTLRTMRPSNVTAVANAVDADADAAAAAVGATRASTAAAVTKLHRVTGGRRFHHHRACRAGRTLTKRTTMAADHHGWATAWGAFHRPVGDG